MRKAIVIIAAITLIVWLLPMQAQGQECKEFDCHKAVRTLVVKARALAEGAQTTEELKPGTTQEVPEATATPSTEEAPTKAPATATSAPTEVPATATTAPTQVPAATEVPAATATSTPIEAPATATSAPTQVPATATSVPPTATSIPATSSVPPTATQGPSLPSPSFNECASEPNPSLAPDAPVRIVTVDKDAEVVRLQNISSQTVNLTGWRMCSMNGNQEHDGIGGVLNSGEIRDFPYAGSGSIWNNNKKDNGALYNANGQLVSYWNDPDPS